MNHHHNASTSSKVRLLGATRPSHQSPSISNFTLIELVIVMAIIGILASVLLPALAKAKACGVRLVCMNNMKQTTMGSMMYSMDYDSYYPGSWMYNSYNYSYFLIPYTKSANSDACATVQCPAWRQFYAKPAVFTTSMVFIFKTNWALLPVDKPYKLSEWVTRPSGVAYLMDGVDNGLGWGYALSINYINGAARRHGSEILAAFYDGSARQLPPLNSSISEFTTNSNQ